MDVTCEVDVPAPLLTCESGVGAATEVTVRGTARSAVDHGVFGVSAVEGCGTVALSVLSEDSTADSCVVTECRAIDFVFPVGTAVCV